MKHQLPIAMSLILAAASPAAQAETDTSQVDVRLSVPADATAEEIYGEIKRTAARACRTNPVYAHGRLDRERACREDFVARAVVGVNRDTLTALHFERTGDEVPDLADARGDGVQGPGVDPEDP
jgi:UrcA family protein